MNQPPNLILAYTAALLNEQSRRAPTMAALALRASAPCWDIGITNLRLAIEHEVKQAAQTFHPEIVAGYHLALKNLEAAAGNFKAIGAQIDKMNGVHLAALLAPSPGPNPDMWDRRRNGVG